MTKTTDNTLSIKDYHFRFDVNPSNVLARKQLDIFVTYRGEERFLRSVFFNDLSPREIFKFCHRIAHDAEYRQSSLKRTTDWAIRNDLFLRNCFNPYYQANPFLNQIGSMVSAFEFFHQHSQTIVQLSTYQALIARDSAIEPHPHQPDPAVADIVASFNQMSGVRTLASCQGVSEVLRYQGYDILASTPHARFAYIWFSDMSLHLVKRLQQIASPHIEYTDLVYPTLQSTGNNTAFLADLRQWIQQSTM